MTSWEQVEKRVYFHIYISLLYVVLIGFHKCEV